MLWLPRASDVEYELVSGMLVCVGVCVESGASSVEAAQADVDPLWEVLAVEALGTLLPRDRLVVPRWLGVECAEVCAGGHVGGWVSCDVCVQSVGRDGVCDGMTRVPARPLSSLSLLSRAIEIERATEGEAEAEGQSERAAAAGFLRLTPSTPQPTQQHSHRSQQCRCSRWLPCAHSPPSLPGPLPGRWPRGAPRPVSPRSSSLAAS